MDIDPTRAGHPLPLSRRRFLQSTAMAVAGGVLFSCTGGKVIKSVSPSTSPTLTRDTRWPIKHVVYLMLENRSFNHSFGAFPGVNGTSVGNNAGREQPLIATPDWLPKDMPHDILAWIKDYDDGRNDGFWGGKDPEYAYSQFTPESIPGYWHLAKEYVLSDHFFASAPGPSYPNHFYFIAGQAGGVLDNPQNPMTYRTADGGTFKSWGCDAVGDNVYVLVKDEHGRVKKHATCFKFATMGEQLSHHQIDWRFYGPRPGVIGYMWNAYNAVHDVFHSDLWHRHASFDVDDVIGDIKRGELPAVSWVVPRFELSDHPPGSSAFSHNWVMDIVTALMRSPMWESTALFITWDEWGGFYDQVAPPKLAGERLGFRVPLLTVSPYAKRNYIDRTLGEFSSPLRFIADNWGLPHLTPRIAHTTNLAHNFDFHKPPRKPSIPTQRARTFGKNACDYPQAYPPWLPGVVVASEGARGTPNPVGCENP
jgi:phospholipase C